MDCMIINDHYPDFGQCPIHLQNIKHICSHKTCIANKKHACCDKCKQEHKGHVLAKNKQELKNMSKIIKQVLPKNDKFRDELKNSVERMLFVPRQLKNSVQNFYQMFKQVNFEQLQFYHEILKTNQSNIENWVTKKIRQDGFEKTKMQILLLEHQKKQKMKEAPQYYDRQTELMKKNLEVIQKSFSIMPSLIRDIKRMSSFLEILQKNNEPVEQKKPVKIEQKQEQRKEQKKEQKKEVKKEEKKQEKEENKIYLSIKDEKNNADSIMKKINESDPTKIFELNLSRNQINSQSLYQILRIQFPILQKLDISENKLKEQATYTLLFDSSIPNLKQLDIRGNRQLVQQFKLSMNNVIEKWPKIKVIIQDPIKK